MANRISFSGNKWCYRNQITQHHTLKCAYLCEIPIFIVKKRSIFFVRIESNFSHFSHFPHFSNVKSYNNTVEILWWQSFNWFGMFQWKNIFYDKIEPIKITTQYILQGSSNLRIKTKFVFIVNWFCLFSSFYLHFVLRFTQ